ncbi:sugar phosphate isomerase/epimerase family protein [Aquirufa sp. ROCK2-A2]
MMNRRIFLKNSSLFALAAGLPNTKFKQSFKLGYSAITWGGKDLLAIEEIASLGFKGIQLRANTYAPFKDKPEELKAALDKAGLQLVMFSSGNVEVDPAKVEASIQLHVNHAKFVKSLGGNAIQLTNSLRKKDQIPTEQELIRLAEVMNEIGAKTKEYGVQSTYHNHMNQWGETPEEVETIVKHMDPSKIQLELDVAHYFQGGGDPAEAVLKFKKVLHSLHIKDVEAPIKGQESNPKSYKFVELGQGRVNLVQVFKNLEKINFKGWAIVELDGVPSPSKTPLECGTTSRNFLRDKISYQF